jgi:hydroxymethylpyrimidine/phosphomethylpyrimidine kinase
MTAITAITAQNTVGVTAIHSVPPETILAQVRAVAGDIGVDAVKIGMLGTVATIHAVSTALDELPPETPVVLDPVMVAESGAELLEADARRALVELLLPRATVATPNIPEAIALREFSEGEQGEASDPDRSSEPDRVGGPDRPGDPDHVDQRRALARAVLALGPAAVVLTGGHSDSATDVFFDGRSFVEIAGETHPPLAAHGSGCTHSSALAAYLAWGHTPLDAARRARKIAGAAVRDGLDELGAGPGPVDVLGLARRHAE